MTSEEAAGMQSSGAVAGGTVSVGLGQGTSQSCRQMCRAMSLPRCLCPYVRFPLSDRTMFFKL